MEEPKSSTAIDLVHSIDHDLRGNAARVWSKGRSLAQGGHGFTSDEQRNVLEMVDSHLDQLLNAAYRLTLWIDAQHSDSLTIVRPIQNVEQVLGWTPLELLRHVDHEMARSLPVVRKVAHDLVSGQYGFTSEDQKDRLHLLYRDVERLQTVVEVIHVWLTKNAP
ncbi:MAG TPA: hypothetical protein VGD58_28615 [Herpetosiphonaceae bacterium]